MTAARKAWREAYRYVRSIARNPITIGADMGHLNMAMLKRALDLRFRHPRRFCVECCLGAPDLAVATGVHLRAIRYRKATGFTGWNAKLPEDIMPIERCPTCGRYVFSMFDHVDQDCENWPDEVGLGHPNYWWLDDEDDGSWDSTSDPQRLADLLESKP